MTTAKELLARVRGSGPAVEGVELVFASDLPPELDVVVRVLYTGVRAALTGRRWWGATDGKPRVIELSPLAPIPAGVALLAVEGDGGAGTGYARMPGSTCRNCSRRLPKRHAVSNGDTGHVSRACDWHWIYLPTVNA